MQAGQVAQFGGNLVPSTGCLERYSMVRLVRLPSSTGIVPVNSLSHKDNSCRLVRLPSSGGISPVNWLSVEPQQRVRLDRPPSSGGISPVNWLPERTSSVRLDEAAQLRRNLARQLVGVRDPADCQVGQAAQLRRNLARQLVAPEGQMPSG